MKLIRRSAWRARYGRGPTTITPERGGVTVHYEGGGKLTGRPHSTCAARVRGIENYHVNHQGWQGIAYSYLACEHGYVFEGRGLGHRTAANGTNSGNQNWYAVCALIGDADPLSDGLLTALRDAIDYMRAHGAGRRINGHRDHLSTSCPGARLYAWVKKGAPRPKSPKPPDPQEETLKTVVDLGAVKPQTIPAGQRRSIAFEVEYADPDKVHSDNGAQPSVAPKGKDAPYAVTVEVVLDARPGPGAELTIASYSRSGEAFERDIRGIELIGARHVLHSNIRMSDAHKYRADVVNHSGADVVVQRAYLFVAH